MADTNTTFEVIRLIAAVATPIVVWILGVLLLRRVEGVKALVAHHSDFQKKWADEYFTCCQQFMQTMERELALLTIVSGLDERNMKLSTELRWEASVLLPKLSELELRIRRSVVFAPVAGEVVTQAARSCMDLTNQLLKVKQGNVDAIINKMNDFNLASRKAHAEMLGVSFPTSTASSHGPESNNL